MLNDLTSADPAPADVPADTPPEGAEPASAPADDAPSTPAKKKTKKKASKKAASKKATTRKKTSRKKAASKASAEPAAGDEEATDPSAETPEDTSDGDEKAKPAAKKKARKKSTRKKAGAKTPAADDDAQGESEPGSDADTDSESESAPDDTKPAAKKTTKRSRPAAKKTTKATAKKTERPAPPARMLINYAPGDHCRIAIVEDGRLQEYFSEPTDQVSRVNNIYVGKVVNVEPAIQAAFVDFGTEENGFLHQSDLHPRYFPGAKDDETERVGKKIPRRSRPPIQECLKRGQEIVVQVLKEGVGTKGPTLTSYLSIPGRYIVMMPEMDSLGVSRKEDDDDKRKMAREILSSLDLPDGFGFILRTAGFDKTKTDLKLDLAYLMRLWKDMEKRRRAGSKPRLLYSESDLLVRSIRDLLKADMEGVVIDHEPSLKRAASFLKIVAPRTQAKLSLYTGAAPIFHAFGIDEQVETIHSREVPLPSGGRLVIDETEALVAIDVNSGRSRSARDSETNAFNTNMEAADEICRQLRLRDLGGLVVGDMIDMRHARHNRAVEDRFRENFGRDRARTTVLPISEFGILQLTRQRMRGSQESLHFAECPSCKGRGLIERPESVASKALRQAASVLDHDRIKKVELVVSPRVAGSLLSDSRTAITRLELSTGKSLDVRVSENLGADRYAMYAYDANGSDVEMDRLPKRRAKPELIEWDELKTELGGEDEADSWAADMAEEAKEAASVQATAELALARAEEEGVELDIFLDDDDSPEGEGKKKKRRRRRRRRRKSGDGEENTSNETSSSDAGSAESPDADPESSKDPEPDGESADNSSESNEDGEDKPKKKRRRRRRRGKSRGDGESSNEQGAEGNSDRQPESSTPTPRPKESVKEPAKAETEPKPKKPRSLYGRGRRKLTPGEVASLTKDD